jgi:hypothetical protein
VDGPQPAGNATELEIALQVTVRANGREVVPGLMVGIATGIGAAQSETEALQLSIVGTSGDSGG